MNVYNGLAGNLPEFVYFLDLPYSLNILNRIT